MTIGGISPERMLEERGINSVIPLISEDDTSMRGSSLISVNEFIATYTEEELKGIIKNPQEDYRGYISPETAKQYAVIVLSRLNSHIPRAGDSFSLEDIASQASLGGDRLEKFEHLYRFDFRSPEEIREEGFLPNPKSNHGTLYEHFAYDSFGSGNFVSTSEEEGKESVLKNCFYMRDGKPIDRGLSEDWEGLEELGSVSDTIHQLYEYRIRGQEGVCPNNPSYEHEREVVIPEATPKQIDFRSIKFVQPNKWAYDSFEKMSKMVVDHDNSYLEATSDWKNLVE